MEKYEVLDIATDQKDAIEQLGTKEKFWFEHEGQEYLFKVGRKNSGEDWVEVVVSELCELLEIPHAKYEFAKYDNINGTATYNFVPDGARLVHGNELLTKALDEYQENIFYKLREYKLQLIRAILDKVEYKPALNFIDFDHLETAFDMFVGYVVLDCLISNQDRHHENWGLIVLEQNIYLAPTFDHASGLGSKERDNNKIKRMSGKDSRMTVEKFVNKAKTPFYGKVKTLSTYEAVEVCAKMNKKATLYWIGEIESLDFGKIRAIFDKIPTNLISDVSKEFAIVMMKENQKRLLNLKKEIENG